MEDETVARLSLLVSVAVSLISGTDTPDVEVDALSILGRSAGPLEVVAQSVGSDWAGSLLSKERFANPSFRG